MDIKIQLGLRGQGLFCCSFVAAVSIRHPMYVCKHFESAIIDIKRWCKQRLRRSPLNSWQLLLWLQSPPHPSKEPDEIRANRSSSKAMRPFLILCKYCATVEVSSSDEELTHKSSGQTVVGILKLVPLSNFRSSLSIFRIFKHVARAQTSVINA